MGVATLAVAAAAAGDVEGHRDDIADLDELDIASALDHLTGDLVAQHQAFRRGGTAANHVLIAAADIGGQNLEDDTVLALTAAQCEFRERDVLDGDFTGAAIDDAAIGG